MPDERVKKAGGTLMSEARFAMRRTLTALRDSSATIVNGNIRDVLLFRR
jgi:hypothetical protein